MEQNGPWIAQGISGQAGILCLLFDPYSELLLVHVQKKALENCPLKSLYVRHVSEERYRLFTPVSEKLSYEDTLLAPNGPFIYVNVFEAIINDGRFIGSFDWHSLQKIELPSGKIISELKAGDLVPQLGQHSPWISSIVGACDDRETIFVNLAIPRENERKLRYYLAKLYPSRKHYEVITELTGTFL